MPRGARNTLARAARKAASVPAPADDAKAAKPPTESKAKILGQLGEVFRTHGYEGASLTLITQATGLGKGSLYHLFPGGKEQMAKEVLAEIDGWFTRHIFAPLRAGEQGVDAMLDAVSDYFASGRRVCLVGVFALGSARDTFGKTLRAYFVAWDEALAAALRRKGMSRSAAAQKSEDMLLGIQGALVLARANQDPAVFTRAIDRMRASLK
jgi:AcrR family transcriptional regulator